MIKLIATDIDGTLVEEGKVDLNPEYFDVIRELRKQGVLFLAASGRQRQSIEHVLGPVIDDIITLSENGAVVMSPDYNYHDVMDKDVVQHIVEDAKACKGCVPMICGPRVTYTENKELCEEMTNSYGYNIVVVDDLAKVTEDICKISVYHPENAEEAFGDEAIEEWRKTMYVACAGQNWLDFLSQGVNKGTALKRFQDDYGITKDETLTFGDNINDIEMLHRASHSFAVANARDEVKEAANFIADSNVNDGVLKVLKAVMKGDLFWSKDKQ